MDLPAEIRLMIYSYLVPRLSMLLILLRQEFPWLIGLMGVNSEFRFEWQKRIWSEGDIQLCAASTLAPDVDLILYERSTWNGSEYVHVLNAPGPELRVVKHHRWQPVVLWRVLFLSCHACVFMVPRSILSCVVWRAVCLPIVLPSMESSLVFNAVRKILLQPNQELIPGIKALVVILSEQAPLDNWHWRPKHDSEICQFVQELGANVPSYMLFF